MASKARAREAPELPVPQAFLERMRALLGSEFPAFLASYERPPAQGLRANTLKVDTAQLRARLPFDLEPVPWSQETFLIAPGTAPPENVRPGKHPYHAAGLYYLQDPSATAPVELLDPRPGEMILDLSAAPGGKSTHIASRLRRQGMLVANEVVNKRAWELAGNLERWGATNVAITTESPERLAGRWRGSYDAGGLFDAVLVDAPCSGEGMFRKGDAARREWTPGLMHACAVRQDAILAQAALLVRPGGRLVYSTCTFAPEEDEGTVARFLRIHPEFSLVEPPSRPGFDRGRPEWLSPELQRPELVRCVRLWPHRSPGEGHFAALLAKRGAIEVPRPLAPPAQRLPRSIQQAYDAFVADTFDVHPAAEQISQSGAYLYARAQGLPDLEGLRYLHPGWWLGEIKGAETRHDRFEPSHALALGVDPATVRRVVEFAVNDGGLHAYLRGENLLHEGGHGWTLVTVDGFPIGWAKQAGGRLKSHYPKGLRTMGT